MPFWSRRPQNCATTEHQASQRLGNLIVFAESSSLAWFYEETFRWGRVGRRIGAIPQQRLLGLLREIHRGNGVLAHGLLIGLVQLGVLVANDLAHLL